MARIGQTRSGLIEDALVVAAGVAIVALSTERDSSAQLDAKAGAGDPGRNALLSSIFTHSRFHDQACLARQ